jgi:hypothetical protein
MLVRLAQDIDALVFELPEVVHVSPEMLKMTFTP